MVFHRMLPIAGLLALASFAVHAQQPVSPPPPGNEITIVPDDRMPVALSEAERAFIRREMRGFLASIQEILEASIDNDRPRVAAAARRVGMNGPEKDHIPKSLAPKLPLEFKQLGLATHRGFDRIADEAERQGTASAPKQLGELMRNCSACHGTWRIVGEGSR